MKLHGKSIIASEATTSEGQTFRAFDPAHGQQLEPLFYEATESDIERAFTRAVKAFEILRMKPAEEVAAFLENIGEQISALGDELINRTSAETGLPAGRLMSERTRTMGQLRMFAEVVREGSWVEAIIDRAEPDRRPTPRPHVRRMLRPVGPVVVFGASNFPLAFSVAGGDTASALAAGNPVIVKGHPAHPGTSEMVARAITRAAEETRMPSGILSLLQGTSHELSLRLVRHPAAMAVGFTGSLKAGRVIFEAAARRPNPIPVFAEMGSVNPVFILPGALREKGNAFAEGLLQSVTLGAGQFCTCPGLVVGLQGPHMGRFIERMGDLIKSTSPATMLHPGILRAYQDGIRRLENVPGVQLQTSTGPADESKAEARPTVLATDAGTFLEHLELGEEVFGPSTVIVRCASRSELTRVASSLRGHLTVTIHGTPGDLDKYKDLVSLLETKAGRLIYNGFPTGVEVCAAMHHGGPYPATTDPRSSSVGAMAIKRFTRPICFQDFPQEALPIELQDMNHRGIWRMVDNQLTKADC